MPSSSSRPRRQPKDDADQPAAPPAQPDPDAERRAAARAAARVPDDQLHELPDLELLEEARLRGCVFTRSVTRAQIIAAATAATAEPEPDEHAGEAGTT